jgi:hypothetical protein
VARGTFPIDRATSSIGHEWQFERPIHSRLLTLFMPTVTITVTEVRL